MIKNKRKMRRKIPVFRVSIEPGADYSQITKIPEIKQIVLEETIYAIKDGIKKNKNSISLFEIAHTDYYVELSKNNWKPFLEKVLNDFLEKEDYSRCAEVRDLISKL